MFGKAIDSPSLSHKLVAQGHSLEQLLGTANDH